MATTAEIQAFINKLGTLAVSESNRRIANGQGFVLPSVCIAQSALETGWGTSGLMTRANAFFGIKAGGSWTGKVYTAGTWEVADGQAYNTTANFRAYDSLKASVKDYYDLITNSRYATALSYGLNSADWKTPKACITAIWNGGYATDTLYVQKIMNTITTRNLTVWDSKIDGVTFSDEDINDTFTFKYSDLIQGNLELQDSGRTIGNNTTVTTAIALKWDKAMTIKTNGNMRITGANGFVIHLASLQGENPTITPTTYQNGDTFPVVKSEKIGFWLTLPNNATLNLEGLNPDIKIVFEDLNLLSADNSEIAKSAIAYFVKIE